MGPEHWDEQLDPVPAQGDIVANVPHGVLAAPIKYLKRAHIRNSGAEGWSETLNAPAPDNDGMIQYAQRGRIARAIVLAYGCELDKQEDRRKSRYPIAPVIPMTKAILNSRPAHHQIKLIGVPSIGDLYVDLRCITSISGDVFKGLKREASMTDDGINALQAHIIAFFTRLDIEVIRQAAAVIKPAV